MECTVILGASRGLGAELVKVACEAEARVVGFGRKEERLRALRGKWPLFEYHVTDFSTRPGQDEALRFLLEQDVTQVICMAGGGPYGLFHEREWKDHLWSWDVSFLFPARVAHALRVGRPEAQLILVGSAVAEADPDPRAASYCAAKHALKGLWSTLRAENPGWDIRLFSPGYIDTELLPANAAVRQKGVYAPADLARELWLWSREADELSHRLYPAHPPHATVGAPQKPR